MIPNERAAIDRLDDYLEAMAMGHPVADARAGVDLDLRTIDHQLRQHSQLPDPPPAFAAALWSDLMQTLPGPNPMAAVPQPSRHDVSIPDRATEAPKPPAAARHNRVTLAHLATAAVLLVSLTLNALVLGPIHLPNRDAAMNPLVRLPAVAGDPVRFSWLTRGAPDRLPLADPYHLAIDPDGNMWVADPWLNQFQVFAPDGAYRKTWGVQGTKPGEFNFFNVGSPLGVGGAAAFAPNGALYVLDPGNNRIQKFSPDLRFLSAWGEPGDGDGQFLDLVDVAVDARGHVYVLDAGRQDVQIFDENGQFLSRWSGSGIHEGQLRTPSGLAITAQGDIVVADTGNQRLQTFSPDGQVLATWGGNDADPQVFRTPADVAIDAEGRVYVTDAANNRVVILDDQGRFLAAWGDSGSEPGQFVSPTGITLDSAGTVYVAERGNNRVQAFRLLPPFGP